MESILCAKAKSLGATGEGHAETKPNMSLALARPSMPSPPLKVRKKVGKRQNSSAFRDEDNLRPISIGFSQLPAFAPQRMYERKVYWRFAANGFSSTAFTLADGANQFLVTTNTTGNLVCYVDSWRLKSIDFYLKDSSSDEQVLVTFNPQTSNTDNFLDEIPRSFSLTSAGMAAFSHYKVKTHPRHPIGSWHKGTTTNQAGTLFTMSASGNMKDYCGWMVGTFEYVPNWVGTVPGYGITGAGTTVSGEFYTHSIMGGGLISIGQNSLV